jgi:hypothetical protein
MDSFKAQRLLKADPSRFSRLDEAKIPYKEEAIFVKIFFSDALKFAGKKSREGVSMIQP